MSTLWTTFIGEVLMKGMRDLEARFPGQIKNVRGRGIFGAFDCASTQKRDEMIEVLKTEGPFFSI